jgi:hypothetical protein
MIVRRGRLMPARPWRIFVRVAGEAAHARLQRQPLGLVPRPHQGSYQDSQSEFPRHNKALLVRGNRGRVVTQISRLTLVPTFLAR